MPIFEEQDSNMRMLSVSLLKPPVRELKGNYSWVLKISEMKRFHAVKIEKPYRFRLFLYFWSEMSLAADPSWVPRLWIGIVIAFLTTSHQTVLGGQQEGKVSTYLDRNSLSVGTHFNLEKLGLAFLFSIVNIQSLYLHHFVEKS